MTTIGWKMMSAEERIAHEITQNYWAIKAQLEMERRKRAG